MVHALPFPKDLKDQCLRMGDENITVSNDNTSLGNAFVSKDCIIPSRTLTIKENYRSNRPSCIQGNDCERLLQLCLRKQTLSARQQPSILLQKRQLLPPTISPLKPLKISMKNPAVCGILPHLSIDLMNDRAIVLMAVRVNWREIRHVQSNNILTSNREIAMAAVEQDWRAYSHTTNTSKEVAMAAVAKYWRSLPHVKDSWRDDLEIALMAVAQYWRAVARDKSSERKRRSSDTTKSSIPKIKNMVDAETSATFEEMSPALRFTFPPYDHERDIDTQRLERQGIHSALEILKTEKQFVKAAVQQDGMVLKYLPKKLRSDKDVVLAAIQNKSDAIKYALGGLNQDPDCWYAANLWNDSYFAKKHSAQRVSVALSTKFDLDENSEDSVVTRFTIMLNDTPYFRDGKFTIFSPNAFNKSTCDPDWTNPDWPCRGTFWSCRKPFHLKWDKPSNHSCWRYSYRYHLEEAKRTNGFMLQVVDYDEGTGKHVLGQGQQIEMVMAKDVGTKVFRICQPVENSMYGYPFESCHISELHSIVSEWYENISNPDASLGCEIQFHRENEAEHWQIYVRILPRGGDLEVKDPWDSAVKNPWDVAAGELMQDLPRWKAYGRSLAKPEDHLHGEVIP